MNAAEKLGMLDNSERSAVVSAMHVVNVVTERLERIIRDLCRRVFRMEGQQDQVELDLHDIRKSIDKKNKVGMYLAFVRLGLSFVPIAGGVAGASAEAIGRAFQEMGEKGVQIGQVTGADYGAH